MVFSSDLHEPTPGVKSYEECSFIPFLQSAVLYGEQNQYSAGSTQGLEEWAGKNPTEMFRRGQAKDKMAKPHQFIPLILCAASVAAVR